MSKPVPGKQYIIENGDTLERISRRAYGDSSYWTRIWNINQTSLKSDDPDIVFPGETIFIPEIAELRLEGPELGNKNKDELTIIIDGTEIKYMSANLLLTMDTASDGWSAEIHWIPGQDPAFDKKVLPSSFSPALVYVGNELQITGAIYNVGSRVSENGTIKILQGYSKTIDLVDSNMKPPYEENKITLKQRAEKITKSFGFNAVFEADTGGVFDRVRAEETEKVFEHLRKLAWERGLNISSTPQGDLLFHEADTDSPSMATLLEGQPPVLEYEIMFEGRKRFKTYRAINTTPFGNNEAIVEDKNITRPRIKTIRVEESTAGEISTVAKWARAKALIDALTFPLPVSGWLTPNGELWKPNKKVSVVSPSVHLPDGFDFIIRSVEFSITENSKTAVLNLVPPQVYTKEEFEEPWQS
jgi:prophage tail gpP-like protein